jgi:hypothetical protein
MTSRVLNDQETNTILHALRSMAANQRAGINEACDVHNQTFFGCDHFVEAPALDSVAIDALCEVIGLDRLILIEHPE